MDLASLAWPLMTTANRNAEIAAADAFLAEAKSLDGAPPPWTPSTWGGEYQSTWIILDSDGSPSAQFKFTARKTNTVVATINLIYRSRPLWRLDMDEATNCHDNPHDAYMYGLPPIVCGPHEHAWQLNRSHLLSQDLWGLPYRRPLEPTIRRLGQGLLWLAGQINLTLAPEQRGFDGPTRADLFDRGGQ